MIKHLGVKPLGPSHRTFKILVHLFAQLFHVLLEFSFVLKELGDTVIEFFLLNLEITRLVLELLIPLGIALLQLKDFSLHHLRRDLESLVFFLEPRDDLQRVLGCLGLGIGILSCLGELGVLVLKSLLHDF